MNTEALEELDAIVACLRDDAAQLREENDEDERAENMEKAADALERLQNAPAQPIAWRVRGYNQFKTGTPLPWRYFDGAARPRVNDPSCCDIEPLYGQAAGDYWDGLNRGMECSKALLRDSRDAISYCVQLFGADFEGLLYRLNAALADDAKEVQRG